MSGDIFFPWGKVFDTRKSYPNLRVKLEIPQLKVNQSSSHRAVVGTAYSAIYS